MGPGDVKDSFSSVQSFIELAKMLGNYITPQYKQAAIALSKIMDNFLQINQSLLKWIHEFEVMDFRDENKPEFFQFYKEFNNFKNGPQYYKMGLLYDQVISIFETNLMSTFKRWFSRDENKISLSKRIFYHIRESEYAVSRYVYTMLYCLDDAINLIKENYNDAQNVQKKFLVEIKPYREIIMKQNNEINLLIQDYLKLSGAIVFDHTP